MTTTMTTARVSRRQLLKAGLGAALGLGLAAIGLALPGLDTPQVAASVPFVAYHNLTGAQHQSRFNDLGSRGYRLTSISIYGDPNDARYAAVWVQQGGAAQRAVHGVTAAGYQAAFDGAVAAGFAPVLVSATGPATSARFAAVFEQGVAGGWIARHGLTDASMGITGAMATENRRAEDEKFYLRSLALYGDTGDYRYAAIWHKNPGGLDTAYRWALTNDSYQQVFDAFTGRNHNRPAGFGVATDTRIASIWRKDDIGPWIARHNLTSTQYQAAFDEYTAKGFLPLTVQGGGRGASTRFAAVFATRV